MKKIAQIILMALIFAAVVLLMSQKIYNPYFFGEFPDGGPLYLVAAFLTLGFLAHLFSDHSMRVVARTLAISSAMIVSFEANIFLVEKISAFHIYINNHMPAVGYSLGVIGFLVFIVIILFTFVFSAWLSDNVACNVFDGISGLRSSVRAKKFGILENFLLTIAVRYRIQNKRYCDDLENGMRLVCLYQLWVGVCLVHNDEVVAFGKFKTPPGGDWLTQNGWSFVIQKENVIIMADYYDRPAHGDYAHVSYYAICIDGTQLTCHKSGSVYFNDTCPDVFDTKKGIVFRVKNSYSETNGEPKYSWFRMNEDLILLEV